MRRRDVPSCDWCRGPLERPATDPVLEGRATPTPADASLRYPGAGLPRGLGDASTPSPGDASPSCSERRLRTDARFCGKKCRQSAFRIRRRRATDAPADRPLRLAYADPPYPGRASKYYKHEASYGGEVDHAALVASLELAYPDGWALSTAADALRAVLPLCPEGARVCAWDKLKGGVPPATRGLHNSWEALIVVRGRARRPGVFDVLRAQPARFGGTLMGRKPLAFCSWLFDCLGMQVGDTLDDVFPGTGIVGRAWAELSREYSRDA